MNTAHEPTMCFLFQESVLAGWFNVEDPSIEKQFRGPHLEYKVYNCQMVSNVGIS